MNGGETLTNKTQYINNRYAKVLREGKIVHAERKEFLKGFSLFSDVIEDSTGGGSPSSGESFDGEISDVVLDGDMPTINQYKGPDAYYSKIINDNYQTGLKARLQGTDKWNKDIQEQSARAGVNPLAIKVIMAIESSGAHSPIPNSSNCVGLMQVSQGIVADLGLNWSKAKSDGVYNIYAGCLAFKNKHQWSKSLIANKGKTYKKFEALGAVLKLNVHGTSWLYNGFSYTTIASQKSGSGGYIYANQVAAMYAGFGRDAHLDTAVTLDPLRNRKGGTDTSGSKRSKTTPASAVTLMSVDDLQIDEPLYISDFTPIPMPISAEESAFIREQRRAHSPPIGEIKGSRFFPPLYDRSVYIMDRLNSIEFQDRSTHQPLNEDQFVHLGGPQENFYMTETRNVLLLLRKRLGYQTLSITRGYDPKTKDNSHSLGIAADIYSHDFNESIHIADSAWSIGIRSIAIGPGFVHIDTGPEGSWQYDQIAQYRGPGTVSLGGR